MATDSKFKYPFDRRLLIYLMILISIFMVLSLVFQYSREKKYRAELLNSDLILLNTQADSYLKEGGDIQEFIKLFKPHAIQNIRLTILDKQGNVLTEVFYDGVTVSSHRLTDNHASRPEIISALRNGDGYTIRRLSRTTQEEYFYSASVIDEHIFRTAVPYDDSLKKMLQAKGEFYGFMLAYALLILCIFYYIIFKLSRSASVQNEKEQKLLKKQLTQNISHELKTPVSGIKGYLETIISVPDIPQEKKDDFIRKSYDLSIRLTHILQDTSLITRMDEGKALIDFENLYLKNIIDESIYEVQDRLKEKGIQIETQIEEFTPINGNYTLLHSIFSNLIDNAIVYSEGDRIEISVERIKKFPHSDYNFYRVCFRDNGIGIDKEHLPKIFERFYRIDKGRSRKLGGTGLGLSIVKNAVLIHKGEIKVRNSDLGGVEFVFTLSIQ